MKWLRIVFVATSIILSLVIVCAIINCEISYKYEIENIFPENIELDSSVIGVYVWNPNNNVAYVDDYNIQFISE